MACPVACRALSVVKAGSRCKINDFGVCEPEVMPVVFEGPRAPMKIRSTKGRGIEVRVLALGSTLGDEGVNRWWRQRRILSMRSRVFEDGGPRIWLVSRLDL